MTLFPFLMLLIAQAAAQSAAPPAPRPDWRPVGPPFNGRQSFYDPASVARAGTVTRVRVRIADPAGDAVSNLELRCANYDARIVGVLSYDPGGNQIGRSEMVTPFRAIIAGSFVEVLAREVCGAAQGPAQPQ
jgi:hypothetical protein